MSCLYALSRQVAGAGAGCRCWCCELAAPVQFDYDPSGFKPLIAQPLAGVLESAYRAELQAIVVALVSGRSVWGLGSHLVR